MLEAVEFLLQLVMLFLVICWVALDLKFRWDVMIFEKRVTRASECFFDMLEDVHHDYDLYLCLICFKFASMDERFRSDAGRKIMSAAVKSLKHTGLVRVRVSAARERHECDKVGGCACHMPHMRDVALKIGRYKPGGLNV